MNAVAFTSSSEFIFVRAQLVSFALRFMGVFVSCSLPCCPSLILIFTDQAVSGIATLSISPSDATLFDRIISMFSAWRSESRADLKALEQKLTAEMSALNDKVTTGGAETQAGMKALDQKMTAEMSALNDKVTAGGAETQAGMKALDQKVDTLAADGARVQSALEELSSRRMTTIRREAVRAAKVDMKIWNSIVTQLDDVVQYQTLWTALWAHFDSVALGDASFSSILTELRAKRVLSSEPETQAVFNCAIPWLIAELDRLQTGCDVVFRDTSKRNAPKLPLHKFDISFVYKGSTSVGAEYHVIWKDLVMTAELKRNLNPSKDFGNALIQISDGFFELRHQQKMREREFAFISDACVFQAFARTSVQGVDQVLTTGLLPLFTPDAALVTSGFVSLVNLLATPAKALGFPPECAAPLRLPTVPAGFLRDNAVIMPHRIGHSPKPDIFFIDQVRLKKSCRLLLQAEPRLDVAMSHACVGLFRFLCNCISIQHRVMS